MLQSQIFNVKFRNIHCIIQYINLDVRTVSDSGVSQICQGACSLLTIPVDIVKSSSFFDSEVSR